MSFYDILHDSNALLLAYCCEEATHQTWLMVQARLAGCISDCLRGAPQGDRRGVLLRPPWFDPGSQGVEQVTQLDKHISHNFSN